MMTTENLLLIGAGLLFLSILSTKASGRLGIPSLVVFLLIGIVAGPEGIGHLSIQNPDVIQLVASFALINILFSGGLDTEWSELKPVLGRGLLLATFGLLSTAFLVAVLMRFLFPISWYEGLLFGSIISCTDVAAVFSVLRSKNVRLAKGLGPMAEFESASNDPMAVFLALTLITLIKTPNSSLLTLIPLFFLQMGVGALCGIGLGFLIPKIINWLNLDQDGLYPPLTIALAVLSYTIAAKLGGSGYLAAYIAGIMMNRQRFFHKRKLSRFHDALSWLSQIAMFLSLGLILHPSHLEHILPQGLLLSAFLIFLARPVSVIVTLFWTKTNFREMLMISWLGLRGAVPIILATFVLYSGVGSSQLIFDLVFFVVVLSVVVQGTTLLPVAKWLKVLAPERSTDRRDDDAMPLGDSNTMTEFLIPPTSAIVGMSIMSLGLSSETLVMLLYRDGATIVPNGRTRIEASDVLVVLANEDGKKELGIHIGSKLKNGAELN